MQIITDYEPWLPAISKARLLANIPRDHYEAVFEFLQGSVRRYEKDEYIQRLGEPLQYSGIVLEGTVEGSFISENYNKINMNHFQEGRSFGEALACVNTPHSPIQLKALSKCTVLLLNLRQIASDSDCLCEYHQTLSTNLIKILASQNIFSNLKLRIANQKSIRDRILMYLSSLVPDSQGWVHVPFTQTALAEFLGVNRSALSRELGNMQDEEILQINGKAMKLLI